MDRSLTPPDTLIHASLLPTDRTTDSNTDGHNLNQSTAPTLQAGQVGVLGFGFQQVRKTSVSVAETTTLKDSTKSSDSSSGGAEAFTQVKLKQSKSPITNVTS